MTEELTTVLQLVAAGELTPQQALTRLGGPAAEPGDPPAWGTAPAPSSPASSPAPSSPAERPVRRIRVNGSYRSIDVIGDATIDTAVAVGAHSARHDGDALVVESAELPTWPESSESTAGGRFTVAALPRSLAWVRSFRNQHLVVRMHPGLPLELDAAGAAVRVSGLDAGVRLRLIASAATLDRLRGCLDIDALTSSVKGSAAPCGNSRIAAESSSVRLHLDRGTDVHVRARNRMGKVVLPSSTSHGRVLDPGDGEAVVGDGTGELAIEAVMSSIVLAAAGGRAGR